MVELVVSRQVIFDWLRIGHETQGLVDPRMEIGRLEHKGLLNQQYCARNTEIWYPLEDCIGEIRLPH